MRSRLFATLITLSSCGGTQEPAVAAPDERSLPSSLTQLVVGEPGWVIAVQPHRLLTDPVFATIAAPVLTPEWSDRFSLRTGVTPDQLEELVFADYGERGFIVYARAPSPARDVVIATAMRMSTVEVEADEPYVRRTGFLGTHRRDLIALDEHTLLYAGGQVGPEVAELVAALDAGSLPRSTLLEDDAVQIRAARDQPAQVYGLAALGLPLETPIGVLLAQQRVVAIALESHHESLAGEIHLRGEFPPGADENFRRWVVSMGETDLGRAVGINQAASTLVVNVTGQDARISFELDPDTLARGIQLLFAEDWQRLLEDPV